MPRESHYVILLLFRKGVVAGRAILSVFDVFARAIELLRRYQSSSGRETFLSNGLQRAHTRSL